MSDDKNSTLRDVAKRAGVSRMTVSRVLNTPSRVKADTIEKVNLAIQELKYEPNIFARGLARGKSMTIAVAYHNPSAGYLSEVLVGALATCRELGHQLFLEDLSDIENLAAGPLLASRFEQQGWDGLLLTPPLSSNTRLLERVHNAGLRTVLLGRQQAQMGFSSVSFDDEIAAYKMTAYLIDHGHQDIAFIRGTKRDPQSARRENGYLKALAAFDLPKNSSRIVQGDFSFKSGMEQGHRLLSLATPPTAIFAANDDMAAGVISAAHRLSVDVPGKVSVVGFDDTEIASAIWPTITTVRQPIADIAAQAVQTLHDQRDMPSAEVTLISDVQIVERMSVAPRKA